MSRANRSTPALCAGFVGFIADGSITYFANDPAVAMLFTSLPIGLISVYFVSSEDAKIFAPYYVGALMFLLVYGMTYNWLVCYMSPRRAVTLLFIVVALLSLLCLGIRWLLCM